MSRSCPEPGCACANGAPKPVARLYVVVDGSLAPGLQIAQAIHAKDEFTRDHPDIERAWGEASNTISVLATTDASALQNVWGAACAADVPRAAFHEEDLQGRMTAIALAPGYVSARVVRGLKPALA